MQDAIHGNAPVMAASAIGSGHRRAGTIWHLAAMVGSITQVARSDGITGLLTIAHVAEGFGLDCEIHAPGPAHRQCMAALRNTKYYELGVVHPRIGRTDPPISTSDYSDELDTIGAQGRVPVPQGAVSWLLTPSAHVFTLKYSRMRLVATTGSPRILRTLPGSCGRASLATTSA